MTPFWIRCEGEDLAQGDLLTGCPVLLPPSTLTAAGGTLSVPVQTGNVVVVTQSCDLEQGKAPFPLLAVLHTLDELSAADPRFGKAGVLEEIRKGRREGLYMLASPEEPANNRKAVVVDFRHLVTLPADLLRGHAKALGPRWRLQSPFVEHFSQAFARFFMRVGLPSAVPEFK